MKIEEKSIMQLQISMYLAQFSKNLGQSWRKLVEIGQILDFRDFYGEI
jgi:hypothetical protein